MHRAFDPRASHHDHAAPLRWRVGLRWLLGLGAALWLATGVYVVQPNERAVVRRCGRALPVLAAPGIHFGWPYGIDQVTKIKVFEQKIVAVGQSASDRTLGRAAEPRRAECLTGDRNLIVIPARVQYTIKPEYARDYLFRAADVAALVENVTAAELTSVVTALGVDEVLTVGRAQVQQEVKSRVQAVLQRWANDPQRPLALGIDITSITISDVQPPQEVLAAFNDVGTAREDKQRQINEARAYASGLLPNARGEAERLKIEAGGFAAEIAQKARGETERFHKMLAELSSGRDLTMRRLILETLEEVLPRLKKMVLDERAAGRLDLGLIEEEP